MAKKVYIYSKLTTGNSSFFKRFSHNKRFIKALNLLPIDKTYKVLDFGTGDGYFLNLLHDKINAQVVGYEPVLDMFLQLKEAITKKDITIINKLETVSETKFNTIFCLEVLEHFNKANQVKLLHQIKNQLHANGQVVLSVPIEVGFASLIKNTLRVLIKQFERDTNLKNIIKALFYKPVKRHTENDYIFSHIGFNYRSLDAVFNTAGFKIIKKDYTPFKYLRGLNSQAFYVLESKNS